MLLLHLGIPPSGHGYAPPIAVAVITVLAKKGLYSAEMHLRVYYSSAPSLSKNFPSMAKKPYWLLNRPRENTTPLRRIQTSPGTARPHSHRRNRAANMAQHVFLFLLYESRIPFPETGYGKPCHRTRAFFAPPGSGVFLHKKKREKERLEHSGLDTITSFSCRACHVSDDVSLYKGNPSFRPCPRCGQSDRECLLLNIRLPE